MTGYGKEDFLREREEAKKAKKIEIETDEVAVIIARNYSNMACPYCGKKLQQTENKRYEDLNDHVSCRGNNPDWNPPLRVAFKCPNSQCPIGSDTEHFFGYQGSLYGMVSMPPTNWWHAKNSQYEEFENNRKKEKEGGK